MSEVKKVITVADKSTKALVTASAGLAKVVAELGLLSESVIVLSQDIEFKQGQLDLVEENTKVAVRKAKAELELRITENEDKVLAELMAKRGYAVITTKEVNALQGELNAARKDNSVEITKAVDVAVTEANREAELTALTAESDHKVKMATVNATNESLRGKVTHLESTVASLENTIKAERDARISIAASEAARQGVVVNNGK